MLVATVHCSDPDCAEVLDVEVAELEELDVLACLCGCTLEVLGRIAEVELVTVVLRS